MCDDVVPQVIGKFFYFRYCYYHIASLPPISAVIIHSAFRYIQFTEFRFVNNIMPLLSILPRMLIFDFENKLFSCAELLIELTSCFVFRSDRISSV